ncbi:class II aldolase/adducin family protein [Halobellus captivus]|uniref:class II aldolase/adducin family protein n=1 Tax=Halobellus captivus TaxID=2592614 RepID=UPI00139694BF|nr:class II aldolase/adducin family protein [Halobellus captivus]
MTPEELVATANRLLYMEGLADTAGHASVRSPTDDNVVYINPFSVSRGEIRPKDVVKITLDNEPVDPDAPDPVAEAEIHTAVYRNRPEINAVLHTHPPIATLFSISGTDLVAAFTRGAIFDRPVPVYNRPDLLTTREEGELMMEAMGERDELLIKAHGAVVAGEDLKRAFTRTMYLEINAYHQLYASILGNANTLTPEEAERITETTWRQRSIDKVWNHYVWEASQNGYLPDEW